MNTTDNPAPEVCVIGVGNPFRGDDSIGLRVVQTLRERTPEAALFFEVSGEAIALMEAFAEKNTVLLIDAAQTGAAAGTLHRFDASQQPLPSSLLRYSTHLLSVPDALEMARALDRLPEKIIVYGIEGTHFDTSESLSPALESSLESVVNQILEELQSLG